MLLAARGLLAPARRSARVRARVRARARVRVHVRVPVRVRDPSQSARLRFSTRRLLRKHILYKNMIQTETCSVIKVDTDSVDAKVVMKI